MKHEDFIEQVKRLDDLERPILDDDTLAALWDFFRHRPIEILRHAVTLWKLDNVKYPTGREIMGIALKHEHHERMMLSADERWPSCGRCHDGIIPGPEGGMFRCSCARGKARGGHVGRFYDEVYPNEPKRTYDESWKVAMEAQGMDTSWTWEKRMAWFRGEFNEPIHQD